jgi:hypothetical protein
LNNHLLINSHIVSIIYFLKKLNPSWKGGNNLDKQEIPHSLLNTKMFITVYTKESYWTLSRSIKINSFLYAYSFKILFNITLLSTFESHKFKLHSTSGYIHTLISPYIPCIESGQMFPFREHKVITQVATHQNTDVSYSDAIDFIPSSFFIDHYVQPFIKSVFGYVVLTIELTRHKVVVYTVWRLYLTAYVP